MENIQVSTAHCMHKEIKNIGGGKLLLLKYMDFIEYDEM